MTGPRILVVSFYFPPDLAAGSFRAKALVEALLEKLPSDGHVDVATTLPNRYSTFDSSAAEWETHPRLTIRRIRLPGHHSGMLDQAHAFGVFARQVRRIVSEQRYQLVCATSSRLMTAGLGAWAARRMGAPLYLDIRDIFVDTMTDVLPSGVALLLKPLLQWLERWTIRQATHINLVSRGFEGYFRVRYPEQSFSFFTNGVDDEFVRLGDQGSAAAKNRDSRLSVLYAGNIGEGQGLHAILPELAYRLQGHARFILIGDGGRRRHLETALAERELSNVELRPPVSRCDLIGAYRDADVLFLHLNDYEAFRKVLPSKVFEYGALGKPILAGVAGYAAEFLRKEVTNAQVFPPCDADGAVAALERLELSYTPRSAFVAKFARSAIMQRMAEEILAYGSLHCRTRRAREME